MSRALAFAALAAAGAGYWLIVTLPAGAASAAGWRHEVLATALGGLALLLACGSRRAALDVAMTMVVGVPVVLVTAVLPLPRLPLLLLLWSVQLALGATALRAGLPAARRRLGTLAALAGVLDIAAITPVFIACELGGALHPPF